MSQSSTDSRPVATRYALALFELAEQKKKLDEVQADLAAVVDAMGKSAELRRLMESPVTPRKTQASAMDAVLASAKAQPLTRSFFKTLAENRRLAALPVIAERFAQMLATSRNEASAEVISAQPLASKQVQEIQKALEKSTGHNTVHVITQVDPSVMGGVVVKIGGKMFDNSIATKLGRLANVMKSQMLGN